MFTPHVRIVLFGQRDLLHYLTLNIHQDIKSRITYSATFAPLNDDDLERYIVKQLEQAKLGVSSFDSAAVELIIRSTQQKREHQYELFGQEDESDVINF